MKTASIFNSLIPSRRGAMRLSDFDAVLHLVPQAAVLIDLENENLALGNSRAAELTGYTRHELVGMIVENLFPKVEGQDNLMDMDLAQMAEPFTTQLRTRSGKMLVVEARLTELNHETHWAVITFEPLTVLEAERRAHTRTLELWDFVRELSLAYQEKDLKCAIGKACQSATGLLNAEVVAVYHLNGSSPVLLKTCATGMDDWLPDQLSADLAPISSDVRLWRKEKPAKTALENKARAAGLAFMVSIPLGQDNAWSGLALIGSSQEPPLDIDQSIPIIQANLTAALQIHTLLEMQARSITELNRSGIIAAAVMNRLHEIVILLDNQMQVMDLNSSACKALGYKLEEVRGQTITSVLIGLPAFNHLLKTLAGAKKIDDPQAKKVLAGETFTSRVYRRSGNSFEANFSIAPLVHQDERIGFVIVIQDLSELEDYRKRNFQLEQQALFGEMTANFVHDIKNPINSLKTGLQLLSESLPPDSPFQANLSRLMLNSDHIADVVNSGLSFIRPNEYKMAPVQLDKVLKRLLTQSWQQRMHVHQVKYELHVGEKNLFILGDLQALEHLFTNLFDNAVDAMRNNPPNTPRSLGVTIRHQHDANQPERVEVLFSDTGPGIPESVRERIFDLFYTTKETGSGLGLAIVKSITTAHRGVASLSSFEGGTIFSIKFPLYTPPAPDSSRQTSEGEHEE